MSQDNQDIKPGAPGSGYTGDVPVRLPHKGSLKLRAEGPEKKDKKTPDSSLRIKAPAPQSHYQEPVQEQPQGPLTAAEVYKTINDYVVSLSSSENIPDKPAIATPSEWEIFVRQADLEQLQDIAIQAYSNMDVMDHQVRARESTIQTNKDFIKNASADIAGKEEEIGTLREVRKAWRTTAINLRDSFRSFRYWVYGAAAVATIAFTGAVGYDLWRDGKHTENLVKKIQFSEKQKQAIDTEFSQYKTDAKKILSDSNKAAKEARKAADEAMESLKQYRAENESKIARTDNLMTKLTDAEEELGRRNARIKQLETEGAERENKFTNLENGYQILEGQRKQAINDWRKTQEQYDEVKEQLTNLEGAISAVPKSGVTTEMYRSAVKLKDEYSSQLESARERLASLEEELKNIRSQAPTVIKSESPSKKAIEIYTWQNAEGDEK